MMISVSARTGVSSFFAALLLLSVSCKKDSAITSNNVEHGENVNANAITLVGMQQVISLPTGSKTYPVSQALLWTPVSYVLFEDHV